MASAQQTGVASQMQNAFLSATPPPNAGGGEGATGVATSTGPGPKPTTFAGSYLSQFQNAALFGQMAAVGGGGQQHQLQQGSAAAGSVEGTPQMMGLSGVFAPNTSAAAALGTLAATAGIGRASAASPAAPAPINAAALQQLLLVNSMQQPAPPTAAITTPASGSLPTPSDADTEAAVSPPITKDAPVAQRPTFVNAKQYKRILKRREARALIEEFYSRHRESGKPYQHESRHRHAMKRPRGPKGRFLTKPELEQYYKDHPDEDPKKRLKEGTDRESSTSTASSSEDDGSSS